MLKSKDVRKFSPTNFLEEISSLSHIDKRPLSFVSERLGLLLNTLQVTETDEYMALKTIADFCTLVSSPNPNQFTVILEPNPNDGSMLDPLLNLACLDSSLAM